MATNPAKSQRPPLLSGATALAPAIPRTSDRTPLPASVAFASRLGRRLERIIATILTAGVDVNDPLVMRKIVREELAATPPLRGRRALNLAYTMAAVYARRFAPPPPWRLVGVNVTVGAGRADLLFTDGRHWLVDELKAARVSPTDPLLATQVARYQRASARYGTYFLGVRVALLRAPARLVVFPATAGCRPLPAARGR